jgi:CubicO group peptidase (beta-lactamase class C family)
MRGIATVVPVLVFGLAAIATQHAAPPSRIDPQRLGRLDTALQRYVDENRVPGVAALVLQDGKPIFDRAFGWRDKEAGIRMTTDTLFRIASQTKAITSAAALMLVEEGKLGLTDPVSRYMPAFAKTTVAVKQDGAVTIVPARRAITVFDLMTHTSGMSYGIDQAVSKDYEAMGLGPAAGYGWYTADKDEPVCQTMERLASLPFVAQPGEAWVYGYSTDVLGCVVERASGMALDEFFRARITGALGMTDTEFFVAASKRDRLAAVYASGPDGMFVRAPDGARGQGHYVDGPRKNFSGGAGLVSTVRDYARFLEMVRNGGVLDNVRLLSPRAVALMTSNQSGTLHNPYGLGHSLAFETTDRLGANGLEPAGSYGWGGAYGSVYRVDPEGRLVLVMAMQLIPNMTDIRSRFQTLVYQSVVP